MESIPVYTASRTPGVVAVATGAEHVTTVPADCPPRARPSKLAPARADIARTCFAAGAR
jgi:hypothetical protein